MKIGEFVIDLFVDAAKGELTIGELIKTMGALEVASVGEIAVLTALADKLVDVTKASMATAIGLEEYAAATGGSTEALEKWQAAGKMVGIENETIASSLIAISQGLVGIKKYGEAAPIMNLLHPLKMSMEKYKESSPEQLLQGIRENALFQRMEAAEQRFVLGKAGLAGMQRILSKRDGGISDKQFSQFIRDAGTMSHKDIKQFEAMHQGFLTIEALSKRIGLNISKWFSGDIMNFLKTEISALRVIADFTDKATRKEAVGVAKDYAKHGLMPDIGNLFLYGPRRAKKDIEFLMDYVEPILNSPNVVPLVPSSPKGSTTIHAPINIKEAKTPEATGHAVKQAIERMMTADVNANTGNLVV